MTPAERGFVAGAPLDAVGRARRFACGGGELWRLPDDAAAVATRLGELGARGVGGFVAHGRDDDGPWLVRGDAPTLAAWLAEHPGPVAWPRAVAMATSLAAAAQACEEASLFPGAIDPDAIAVAGDDTLSLRADALVLAMVGGAAGGAASSGGSRTRWLGPEQAAGRPADNAGNRYVIGLVTYRLLAGEHPFADRGLRLGLDDQAQRGAPPFPDPIATDLPPGLQSACLRLLDPDPARRPATARALAQLLRPVESTGAPEHHRSVPPTDRCHPPIGAAHRSVPPTVGAAHRVGGSRTRAVMTLAPLVAAVGVVWWMLGAVAPAPTRGVAIAAAAPMTEARTVEDCAGCHPRQAGEWSRSVMAHAATSPLFQALEMLIEEQVGRDRDCPDGAGVLRPAGAGACTSRVTGLAVTGSGGEGWCVNCHAPGENLGATLPAWSNVAAGTRRPLRDLLGATAMQGISCVACHQTRGPVHPGDEALGRYEGNPSWISVDTGARFSARPEDLRGLFGIANSGYLLDPTVLLGDDDLVAGGAHRRADAETQRYLGSSEMCGACHDVRLFGTDAIAGPTRGEHFKRLRNAYSEWATWADDERRQGRAPASCQDCHMSLYPGVCVPGDGASLGCPEGTIFDARAPGSLATGHAASSSAVGPISAHYFSGVDVPMAADFDPAAVGDATLDLAGLPLGARGRRDLLLAHTFDFAIDAALRDADRLIVPIVIENVGAGHRAPAGFSQEREIWVHLRVTDARGDLVYEVGRVDRGDEDLHDKVFLRVSTDVDQTDRGGRPIGLFGADVADGPDVPRWSPSPARGGSRFAGRGLINFQNGFLRCVRCIGTIDADGACQAGPGQESRRADRYVDGDYDPDTGECRSNLRGLDAFLETYFPIGGLDAGRGLVKGPDAIIDTRSLPPGEPVRYVYDLDAAGHRRPYTVEARLLFRAFPPYLINAFIDYERVQDRRGLRPTGPLIDRTALDRLEVVELAKTTVVIP